MDARYPIFVLANGTSAILATVTAYLYYWLPNVQDLHGTCVFHFSLNIASLHAVLIYYLVFLKSLLPEYACFMEVTAIVFLVSSINAWSVILSYNTWKQTKEIGFVNRNSERRLDCYRLLGYGVPTLYVVIMLPFLRRDIFNESNAYNCTMIFATAIVIPIVTSPFLNLFYFVDSKRRLWNLLTNIDTVVNENSRTRSLIERLKFKMGLNLKLCLTMNIPFSACVILYTILLTTTDLSLEVHDIVYFFVALLALLQGTLIFLAAVAFRKRVIKGFDKYGGNSCLGCLRSLIPENQRLANDDEETECEPERCPSEEGGVSLRSFGSKDEV